MLRAAAACAVLVAGCTVEGIELTGRACPCAAQWVCDPATNVCVSQLPAGGHGGTAPGGAGGSAAGGNGGGAGGAGTGGSDGGGGSGGGSGGGGVLRFADEFDGDMSSWEVFGGGTWAVADGEMQQTDPLASNTFVHAPALADLADYRVTSRMRQLSGSVGGAMELVFRVDVSVPEYYFCNYEPNTGQFLVMGANSANPNGYTLDTLAVEIASIPDYDPMAGYTMVVEVHGSMIRCWIEELPEASLTLIEAALPLRGTTGMKVWRMATAYDYFRVYELSP